MPLFDYKAYDASGNEVSGQTNGEDLTSVRADLKSQGFTPFEVAESKLTSEGISFGSSFGLSERVKFSRQMAALLKGGVPLTKALAGLENQSAWVKFRPRLVNLRESIEKGQDLSVAMGEQGDIFDGTSLSVIKVGETTGKLDFAFEQLALHLEREMEHRRRFIAAVTYPAITAVISAGVLAFLMVYLVPSVAKMFADVQGKLPLVTRVLITFSNLTREYWIPFVLLSIAGLVLFRFAMKTKIFRRKCEIVLLKIPVWGRFIEGMRMESWARNSGMMVRCGVSLLDSVKVLEENSDSILHSEALKKVETGLEKGNSFTDALKNTDYFPVFLLQMIEAGEASGELAPMLESSAKELEAENKTTTDLFLSLLEPLLIVFMGIVVGTIMIGILLPVYEMNKFL